MFIDEKEITRDEVNRIVKQAIAKYKLTLGNPPNVLWLATQNVAPAKPRTGMIMLADGTNWNPGSGAGVYAYYGSAWHKLG